MSNQQPNEALARFTAVLPTLRGEVHRYLARMAGSVVDGEDILQDALLAAATALQDGTQVENIRPWLFRIAHNTALNTFKARQREAAMKDDILHLPPSEQPEKSTTLPEALTPYLSLTPLQRSIVILRDVLGYSAQEVAELTEQSLAAVKSALHRGRNALAEARETPPSKKRTLPPAQMDALRRYADLFNAHDFDALRDMLSAEVRLELVSVDRREGKERVSGYFTNYSKRDDWHMTPGIVEGRPAILARDRNDPDGPPGYFILLTRDGEGIRTIRDFRYARYVMADAVWQALD